MPKTSRQLAREVAEVLSRPPRQPSRVEYTIHGVERGRHGDQRGINHIEYTTDPKQAYRLAETMADKDYLVTVLAQDQQTGRYRPVMRSDRVAGAMKITVMDPTFPEGRSAHSSRRRDYATMKLSRDNKPRILKISKGKTFAGQRSITVDVQYPGEAPSRVEFVGPSSGGSGPVVMVTKDQQTFIHDPSRFGTFGQEWIRQFFKAA